VENYDNVFVGEAFGEELDDEGDDEDEDDDGYEDGDGENNIPRNSKLRYTEDIDIEDFGSTNKTHSSSKKGKGFINKKRGRGAKNIEYEYELENNDRIKHKH
jgi:hypothetical protein